MVSDAFWKLSAHRCTAVLWRGVACGGSMTALVEPAPLPFGSPLPSNCRLPLKSSFVPFHFLQSKPRLEGLLEMAFEDQGYQSVCALSYSVMNGKHRLPESQLSSEM